ncbi:MAG: FAD-dependent oxidoreductase [Rhizobacter sp.]|nr:FAD-dependent oxidoreductase [Chlorobiales bacterium]
MQYDFIVIGSGIGGLTAASLLAKRGFSVMTLEGSHVAGGCASSYTVKHGGEKFIFEAGATTIVGLDEHQPLRNLETELNITFPVVELSPSMTVHFADKNIIRYKDKSAWIEECYRKFFAETNVSKTQVEKFWQLVFRLSDFVWQVSERNRTFPPRDFNDYWQLATHNSPLDFPKLRFLFKPTLDVIKQHGLDGSSDFVRFCDEQLMITSQATSAQVPFLYAAPCLAYTNSGNFYSYGGILALAETIIQKYKSLGGDIKFREEVTLIARTGNGFKVTTASGNTFESKELVSNATIWNMATLTKGRISEHFRGLSQKFSFGWGAFTMSVAVKNHLPENLTLHHQFVLDAPVPHCTSKSFFISLSAADDRQRQPEGIRLFSVSMHTVAEPWLEPDGQAGESYATKKAEVEQFIFAHLERHLAGFSQADIVFKTSATPKSWQEWTFRKNGRVGGLPNTMEKNVFDLIAPVTPFKGLYLVGDTVYPGQGIAGVCLSGQNAVHRILNSSQPSRQTPLPTRVSEPVA